MVIGRKLLPPVGAAYMAKMKNLAIQGHYGPLVNLIGASSSDYIFKSLTLSHKQ